MQDWLYILGPLALAFVIVTVIDWRRRQRHRDRYADRRPHGADNEHMWHHSLSEGSDGDGRRCGSERSNSKDGFWDNLFDGGDGGGDGGGGGD